MRLKLTSEFRSRRCYCENDGESGEGKTNVSLLQSEKRYYECENPGYRVTRAALTSVKFQPRKMDL